MKNKILILGASGLIGRYLMNEFGNQSIGTYCKNPVEGLVYFDLLESSIEDLNLKDIRYVIICSAIAKIDDCVKDFSREINVNKLKKIIKEFSNRKIIPIFISTASVFNGYGNYKEDDLRNPINEYGKQKQEIEEFIIKELENYLIIRLGKVFGECYGESFFSSFFLKDNKGDEIKCTNEKISLTSTKDVAKGIRFLIENNSNGIYHIDSGVVKTIYEFAKEFFESIKKNVDIKKCSEEDFNFIEQRAKNQFLDNSKFVNESRFVFENLNDSFKRIRAGLGIRPL
jgi:dTDP-4-dehydrorhamnose reductase